MAKVPGSGKFGAIGTARNFINVVKELNLDEIRDEAERIPRLLVLAPDDVTAVRIAALLTGPNADVRPSASALSAHLPDLERLDAIVVYDPAGTGRADEVRARLQRDGRSAQVVRFEGTAPDDERAAQKVRSTLTNRLPQRAPAMGRAFPAFREAAIKAILDETAQVNAQFALVSNVPAVIPVLGGFFAAGADLLVLTKNQLLMLYKVAAVHGKDLGNRKAFFQEMLSVVGAAMLWRTVARELASFLPFAAGTIPKVIIAYAGTVVVGRTADFYYRFDRRPSGDQVRGFYRQAADAAKRIRIPGFGDDAKDVKDAPALPPPSEGESMPAREAS